MKAFLVKALDAVLAFLGLVRLSLFAQAGLNIEDLSHRVALLKREQKEIFTMLANAGGGEHNGHSLADRFSLMLADIKAQVDSAENRFGKQAVQRAQSRTEEVLAGIRKIANALGFKPEDRPSVETVVARAATCSAFATPTSAWTAEQRAMVKNAFLFVCHSALDGKGSLDPKGDEPGPYAKNFLRFDLTADTPDSEAVEVTLRRLGPTEGATPTQLWLKEMDRRIQAEAQIQSLREIAEGVIEGDNVPDSAQSMALTVLAFLNDEEDQATKEDQDG